MLLPQNFKKNHLHPFTQGWNGLPNGKEIITFGGNKFFVRPNIKCSDKFPEKRCRPNYSSGQACTPAGLFIRHNLSKTQVSCSKELNLTEVEFIWILKSLLVIDWRVVKNQIQCQLYGQVFYYLNRTVWNDLVWKGNASGKDLDLILRKGVTFEVQFCTKSPNSCLFANFL